MLFPKKLLYDAQDLDSSLYLLALTVTWLSSNAIILLNKSSKENQFSLHFIVRSYVHLSLHRSFSLHFILTTFDTHPKTPPQGVPEYSTIPCITHFPHYHQLTSTSLCHIFHYATEDFGIWMIVFPWSPVIILKNNAHVDGHLTNLALIALWKNTLKVSIPDLLIVPNSFSDMRFVNIICTPIFIPPPLFLLTKYSCDFLYLITLGTHTSRMGGT